MVAKPPLHSHHDDPVALIVLDLGGLPHGLLGEHAHTAQLAAAREHRVHVAERHGVEIPIHRRDGGIEQSGIGNHVLHTAGEGCVDHPMRVDQRPEGTKGPCPQVEREAADGVRPKLESGPHRRQWRHTVPLLGRAADVQPVEPERLGDFLLDELLDRDAGDPPHQLADEPAERQRVVAHRGSGLVCRLRPRQRIGHVLPVEDPRSVVDDRAQAV